MPPRPKQRDRSGATLHASTVAFAPARSLTSHARRHYQVRYKGKFALPRLVFGFDVFLAGLLFALLCIDAVIFFQFVSPTYGGISLTLVSPPLRGSDVIPVEAVVRADDQRIHEDVSIRWRLPDWVEIVRSEPALQKDGSIHFGTVVPGIDYKTHLVIRARAKTGSSLPFRFTIHQYDPLGLSRDLFGQENRMIESSALSASLAFTATSIVPGAVIPIRVQNLSRSLASAVSLRLMQKDSAADARFVSGVESLEGGVTVPLGELRAGEERYVYLAIPHAEKSDVTLRWQLVDDTQVINETSATYHVSLEPWLNVAQEGDVFSTVSTTSLGERWVVIPVDRSVPGGRIGPWKTGITGLRFPALLSVRYYSESGDQIGVGPLPPKVGESTTYWAAWKIPATSGGLTHVSLETTLPRGVTATGKFAAPYGSTFQISGSVVHLSIPELPPTGANPAVFAFEIRFTPTSDMKGNQVPLIAETSAQAVDVQSGALLQSTIDGQLTSLPDDTKAQGKGRVE